MVLLEKSSYQENKELKFLFEFNIYFFLIVINFLTYSVYAVASKYNIFIIEILINLNFIIFYFFYKKNPYEKISLNFSFTKIEILFFVSLLFALIFLLYSELMTPLFGDEIAPTRRATRTAYFSSIIFLEIINSNYLKSIPLKHIIQFLNIVQLIFVISILYLFKKKSNILNLILLLIVTFVLRLIVKDGLHFPPLNHLSSTIFISLFGLNHFTVRLAYLVPFWIFLIFLHKLISENYNKKHSLIFILSISFFPILLIGSTTPDHSFWSSMFFTYLCFYIILKKKIDYKFCILIISIAMLFRITIFTGFILVGLCFLKDCFDKKIIFFDKIIHLIKDDKILIFFLVFSPLLLVSLGGTPNFEGLGNVNPFDNFIQAIKSKIIVYSLIKQIPPWYYLFLIFIFLSNRKFEILIFFTFNLFIYFSIDPNHWGLAKYVLEYAVPFTLVCYFIFIKFLLDRKKIFLAFFINIIIMSFNIYDVYKFPNSNISGDVINKNGILEVSKDMNKKTKYILKIPYSYDEALKYVSKNNAKTKALIVGTTYGFLPQILENYNYNEFNEIVNLNKDFDDFREVSYSLSKKITKIRDSANLITKFTEYLNLMKKVEIIKANKQNDKNNLKLNSTSSISSISDIKNLEYIIIVGYGQNLNLIENLLTNEWFLEKEIIQKNYRSTTKIYKKN